MKKLLILLFFIFPLHAEMLSSEDLMYSPDQSQVKVSPSGRWISFLEAQEDKTKTLNIIDMDSMKMYYIVKLDEDNDFYNYQWVTDDDIFISVKSRDSDDFEVVVNVIEGEKKPKIEQHRVKAKGYIVDRLLSDPEHILFAKPDKKNTLLYQVPLKALYSDDYSTYTPIEKGLKGAFSYFFDEHKQQLFTAKFDEDEKSLQFFYKVIGTNKWIPIFTLTDADYQFFPIGFTDQDHLAVITNKNTDKSQVSLFNINTQEITDTLYQHPKYDIQSAELDDNGNLIAASYIKHGKYTTDYFIDAYEQLHSKVAEALGDEQFFWVDSSIDGKTQILFSHSATVPGKYYLYQSETNHIELLFSVAKNKDATYAKTTFFNFKAYDGTNLEGYLTKPINNDKQVLLVMPHGGPIGIRESDEFSPEVQYLASRGFTILRVNFRGSAGFGKEFLESGVGQFGNLIEQDISAAVAHIRSQYSFKHTCSIGASYGGYSAVMLAIKHPDIYECVIASFGIYDLPLLYNASNIALTKDYQELIERTVGEYSQDLKDISPVYQATSLKAPVLIIAGKQDEISGFEQSNRLYYVLKRLGHDVEKAFFERSGHGHQIWYYDQIEAALANDFLERKLNLNSTLTNYTESEKKAVQRDAILLADTFDSKTIETDRKKESFDYYQLAANLDHDRAMFNVGSYYHRGDNRPIDIKKAIEYYTRAAELGYKQALERLGYIYSVSKLVKPDYHKAKEFFQTAFDKEHSIDNAFNLASIYCIADNEIRDIDKCLSMLNSYANKVDNESRQHVREQISIIMQEGNYSENELKGLHSVLAKLYGLNYPNAILELERKGLFKLVLSDKFNGEPEIEQLSKQLDFIYKLDDEQRFGIEFYMNRDGLDTRRDRLVVFTKWHFTPDDKALTDFVYYQTLWGDPITEWSTYRTLDETSTPGTWTLDVMGANQQLLYQNTFKVTAIN